MGNGTKVLLVICAAIAVVCIGGYLSFTGNYNSMVALEEAVDSQWGQVQNVYQRRLDLIPNLVETVKGAASHEERIFTEVAEARSRAGGVVTLSADILDDSEAFARFQQVQGELTGALQRLISVSENYPQLQTNQNFLALQDQLEGTENRISVERKRFNDAVREYNTFIKQFPRVIIANMTGFSQKQYFSADNNGTQVPAVSFE